MVFVGFKLPPLIAMTLSLLSPSPSALCFLGSTSSLSAEFSGHFRRLWTSRSRTGPALPVLTRASSEKDDDKPAFNPFGFVTDNPSSRSAIQMPESPAEDGNVGQMLYVTQFLVLYLHYFLYTRNSVILMIRKIVSLLC